MAETRDPIAATFERAMALHQQGRLDDALSGYALTLQLHPRHADALHLLGVIAAQTNRLVESVDLIGQSLQIDPANAVAHNNYANALRGLGRREAAVESFGRAIELKPDYADAYYNRGVARVELAQLDLAVEDFSRTIALKPAETGAYAARAHALRALGRLDSAIQSLDDAGALQDSADLLNARGILLASSGRMDGALASFRRAADLQPERADIHNNLGNALRELQRYDDALASFERALAIQPDYADAHYNRGLIQSLLNQFEPAIASYDQVIALQPSHAAALHNRALALHGLKRYHEAVAGVESAIQWRPDFAEAHHTLGLILCDLEQFERAIANHDRAIALKPDYVQAHASRGHALMEAGRFADAAASYEKALMLKPGHPYLPGLRLYAKLHEADWSAWQAQMEQFTKSLELGECACPPFQALALVREPALQRKVAENWTRERAPPDPSLAPLPRREKHDKIRIGYFSADFRRHAVATLTAQLFEIHDRARVEVTAFSFGPNTQDPMRKRMEKAFDHFVDVRNCLDRDVAILARSLKIDIAVDLGGFTSGARPTVLALRAAPLQVSFMGFTATMGADYIDYLIADRTSIPVSQRHHYREKIISLPQSFMVNDATREIAAKHFTRGELGLPQSAFVFCCFNNTYKIAPETFDNWMAILRRVAGSVLWLSSTSAAAMDNLRREAARLGVNESRLIFAPRMASLAEHLARHRAADLFLDTLPFNAHTTACDALWAGLPVLTCTGEAFAGRVAASLLAALGLQELITASAKQYRDLAVDLAGDPQELRLVREKLADQRLKAPLFNTPLYAKHLEAAYEKILERHQAGLPPEHIDVQPHVR